MNICFDPIGYVKTEMSDEDIRKANGNVISKIIIKEEYIDGLQGLEGYSHILVISYLNKLRDFEIGVLKVKPRRLTKYGLKLEELPEVGVFAVDSPARPNPIGLSIAEIIKIDKNVITVKGLDLFNETPILDIKPYSYERVVKEFKVPDWYSELLKKTRSKII
ncbi:MAG: tRNA (N6-threonylcarbamoyladenosine(37)-N6)-methyltransferase TrmO [Nitrososphaeria archaeon]|jgi:tRNA-Thr(GGU) m(6)t(6)A37 methyltransferase TsaA|nr:tRNA (N6-threonylcarbamoyladenosine(37)-N6)-methyltransferase TrmO [Nitrososphaerota archaeon]